MGYWQDKFAKMAAEAEENARKKKAMVTLQSGDEIRSRVQEGLDAVRKREAPQATTTTIAPVRTANAAQINTAAQDQFRARQLVLADRVNAVATGGQMGAGELAARREGNRAIAQQQAYARMGRGANAATAARTAATNTANIGLNTAGQAAQAATTDRQMADQTMAGLLTSGRSADIGLATGQAGLNQQAGLANMDAQNQRVFQQAGLDQSTSLANMQSRLQAMGMNDQASLAYLSQLYGVDAAEMQARLQQEQLRLQGQANKNQLLGNLLVAGGTVAGAYLGGPGGAAAGGAAGGAASGTVS
jgi:hypothetical protein